MVPLSEYPRPQMRRDSYMCLNGTWELKFLSDGENAKSVPIVVPYSPESEFSTVQRTLQAHETMLYSTHVEFAESIDFSRERLILHFGAVDYLARVFIDKNLVCTHEGGYLPFSVELDRSSFDLDVSVQDPGDTKAISRGKQSTEGGGIWYPKTSGIWQTVWLEKVPACHIESLKITPDLEGFYVEVASSDGLEHEASLSIEGRVHKISTGRQWRIDIESPELWSPENPRLYDFEVSMQNDKVQSYVGLRTFSVGKDERGKNVLKLNGNPYFHHGLLDQGYYKGGYYTPQSDQDFVNDIMAMKAMGFNTLRKHIKIEPLRWYYHCDRLGMLVWQDMVSGGIDYKVSTITFPLILGSFLKDDRYDKFSREDSQYREQWEKEAYDTVRHLYNCTSLAMWVPFNEGWGQFDSERIVQNIKALDPSRTIDHASGWHDQGIGDFKSLHVYFYPYRYKEDKKGRAVILTEFGGYGYDTNTTKRKSFIYRTYNSKAALTKGIVKLYEKQIIPAKEKGLAASIYTQVSDVEQEVNGLLTYDHKSLKVNEKEILDMSKRLLGL